MEFPIGQCLDEWRLIKAAQRERFRSAASQLDYRLKWYQDRQKRKPMGHWPDEVRAWLGMWLAVGDKPCPFPLRDGGVIFDFLAELDPSPEILSESASFVVPDDIKRGWVPGAYDVHRAIIGYFGHKLCNWLQASHGIATMIAHAGTLPYICLLRLPIRAEAFYRTQSLDVLINVLLKEGHGAIYMVKLARSYCETTMPMKEILERIKVANGGKLPTDR